MMKNDDADSPGVRCAPPVSQNVVHYSSVTVAGKLNSIIPIPPSCFCDCGELAGWIFSCTWLIILPLFTHSVKTSQSHLKRTKSGRHRPYWARIIKSGAQYCPGPRPPGSDAYMHWKRRDNDLVEGTNFWCTDNPRCNWSDVADLMSTSLSARYNVLHITPKRYYRPDSINIISSTLSQKNGHRLKSPHTHVTHTQLC